jgi:hypothetical protein
MLSLAAPAWLAGLLLLPLLRWWHRGGAPVRALPVARLALWQGAGAATAAAGVQRPPDPVWRRRALLLALLCAALAAPQLERPGSRITVWVDDSPSLLAREDGGRRLELALAQAKAALHVADEVEWRALGAPWQLAGTRAEQAGPVLAAGAAGMRSNAPAAPPMALLRADRQHWLLTDAVHPSTSLWPAGHVPDRVIQVGTPLHNLGLTRLAARRLPDAPGMLDLLVAWANGGSAIARRTLVLTADGREVERRDISAEAGAGGSLRLRLNSGLRLEAQLAPPDRLSSDDRLLLETSVLQPQPIRLDPRCGPLLQAAVRAHPALRSVAGPESPRLQILCGDDPAVEGAAVLRLHADRLPAPVTGPLAWDAGLAPVVPLAVDALRVAGRLQPAAGDQVLLSAGAQVLAVQRAPRPGDGPRIDTVLDPEAMGRTPDGAWPRLMNRLLEQLIGGPLLDAVASTGRPAQAVQVTPGTLPATVSGDQRRSATRTRLDLAPPLLWLALALLLWELASAARRLRATTQVSA